jgi:pimeloyl-ACP methyl ester carboxylesterase
MTRTEEPTITRVVSHDGTEIAYWTNLLGHSFGGFCAFGAATLTSNIRKLVLYEGWPAPNPEAIPPALQERMNALLAEGERERALEAFFREIVQMPDHEFERYRALPAWQARIAAAHTITREDRRQAERTFDPEDAKKITVPVLLMIGGATARPRCRPTTRPSPPRFRMRGSPSSTASSTSRST